MKRRNFMKTLIGIPFAGFAVNTCIAKEERKEAPLYKRMTVAPHIYKRMSSEIICCDTDAIYKVNSAYSDGHSGGIVVGLFRVGYVGEYLPEAWRKK